MTTAPTIKIELANDAPAPQDRGRKVSERIRGMNMLVFYIYIYSIYIAEKRVLPELSL